MAMSVFDGIKDVFKKHFQENEDYLDDEILDEEPALSKEQPKAQAVTNEPTVAPVLPKGESKTVAMPFDCRKTTNVMIVKPVDFVSEHIALAEYLMDNKPLIINFEHADEVNTRHLTDFLNGVVYAIGGKVQKISNKVIICSPSSVNVNPNFSVEPNRTSTTGSTIIPKSDEGGQEPWKK